MKTTKEIGDRAEALAATFLEGAGYRVVARNYRAPGGELDLVAYEGAVLCFVEVRARATTDFGDPLETIDGRKRGRIITAARHYLTSLTEAWPSMRFDAVGVVLAEPPQLRLIRGAFEVDR